MIEAEVSRAELTALALHVGDRVSLVFRHVRLFEAGTYEEHDLPVAHAAAARLDPGAGI